MATHAKLIVIHSTSAPIRMNLNLSLHPTNVSDAHNDCSLTYARTYKGGRDKHAGRSYITWPVFASRYTHVFYISL